MNEDEDKAREIEPSGYCFFTDRELGEIYRSCQDYEDGEDVWAR